MSGEDSVRTLRLHAVERDGFVSVQFLHHEIELTPLQARQFVKEVLTAVREAQPDPRRPRIEVAA